MRMHRCAEIGCRELIKISIAWGLAMIMVVLGVVLAFVIFYKWISKK